VVGKSGEVGWRRTLVVTAELARAVDSQQRLTCILLVWTELAQLASFGKGGALGVSERERISPASFEQTGAI
jgi:hypothetical protein